MIILTNSTSVTLGPGQSATFDTVVLHTGAQSVIVMAPVQ